MSKQPTPFRFTGKDGFILAGESTRVAQLFNKFDEDFDNAEANGEFIVRAANCHDDLLAACKAFVVLFNSSDMRPEDECHEVYALASAAIAKASEAPSA